MRVEALVAALVNRRCRRKVGRLVGKKSVGRLEQDGVRVDVQYASVAGESPRQEFVVSGGAVLARLGALCPWPKLSLRLKAAPFKANVSMRAERGIARAHRRGKHPSQQGTCCCEWSGRKNFRMSIPTVVLPTRRSLASSTHQPPSLSRER